MRGAATGCGDRERGEGSGVEVGAAATRSGRRRRGGGGDDGVAGDAIARGSGAAMRWGRR